MRTLTEIQAELHEFIDTAYPFRAKRAKERAIRVLNREIKRLIDRDTEQSISDANGLMDIRNLLTFP